MRVGNSSGVVDVTDQYTSGGAPSSAPGTVMVSSGEVQAAYDTIRQIQGLVQQAAPQLSGQWGYLAKQGQLITSGQSAALSWPDYIAAVKALTAAAENQSTGYAAGETGQLQKDTPAMTPPAGILATLEADAVAAVPWIIGGFAALLFLPMVVNAVRGERR